MNVPGAQQPTEKADAAKAYSLVAIAPQPFDKYTLIGKLGHGGMAEVNLAVADGKGGFRKLVVIKRLHGHLAMEPGFIDMFLDEARLAARLNHPHCVQTHEVGEWQGNHFLAMEYLDGQGLERLLRMSGQKDAPVPIDVGVRIISDALDGLAYAHELTDFDGSPLCVVHRDVSPQNIFITYNGVVKLLDFGIAKAATHVVETRTGVIKGKYAYIAPEQALAGEVDHRADIWSMGVVLWEVLTGRRLFKSVNELATLHETLQGVIKPPSAHRPEVPPGLDAIAMRALTREVKDRYQSAQEMKDELDRWLTSFPKPAGRSQIARIMRDRFGEVIDTHKETLAQCLSGAMPVTASGFHQLIEPMVTPSGMSPISAPGVRSATVSGDFSAMTPSTSGQVLQQAPPAKSSGYLWQGALIVLVVALGATTALMWPFGGQPQARPAQDPTITAQPNALPVPPPVIPTTPPAPSENVVQPTETASTGENPTAPTEGEPTNSRPTRAERLAALRAQRRQNQQQNPSAETEEPAPSSNEAPGFLTLATTPWARVRLGNRDLGTTPLIRVELPAGTHTLQLTNPEQDIDESYRVTIRPGETLVRRLGLH